MLEFVRNNRRLATVDALVSDIQWAHSNAASAGINTILCHSTSGTACSGNAYPDWTEGGILFRPGFRVGVGGCIPVDPAVRDGRTTATSPGPSRRIPHLLPPAVPYLTLVIP